MASRVHDTRRNSTTDRPIPLPIRALRLWFAIESKIAPESAERRAARMFVTPPRQKRRATASVATVPTALDRYDVDLRDRSVRVAATTLGDGPTAMLLHGWGGSASDMAPMAGAFAAAGFRAVTFDMPGHGRSPGRESSLVEFLAAMRAVSNALGAPEVIVGHSFGGAAAVFGITELGLPARGAVLLAPAPGPAYFADRFARTVGLPAERASGMLRRVVERVGRSVESLDAITAAHDACVPALIFHDPADREVPWKYAAAMRDAWRGSRLVPAPALGHRRILRDPSTIEAAVEFARALSATPSTGVA